ncbi:MAG: DMT family transporter [Candidatus Thermoplasmatota archaeon]|nr:DMT family transporter [Candidatus Thermoplasmatota archaeon]
MSVPLGEAGGLAAALFWALSSTLFTLGGKRQSHQAVNSIRLLGATVMLGLSHLFLLGTLFPDESLYVYLLLGLSGMIGLALGDGLLMWAHVTIGPRLSMLLMSMVPIVTTTTAWYLMGETIEMMKIFGMIVTISGVSWVILEGSRKSTLFKVTAFGIALGIGGMLGQAVQLLIAKEAMICMDGKNPALTATYIRILFGTAAIWMVSLNRYRLKKSVQAFRDRKFMTLTILGTTVGPFLGVWASYVAIAYAPIGIASTLMALAPVFMIPISFLVFKDRPTFRNIMGTMVAIIGVAVIFLV